MQKHQDGVNEDTMSLTLQEEHSSLDKNRQQFMKDFVAQNRSDYCDLPASVHAENVKYSTLEPISSSLMSFGAAETQNIYQDKLAQLMAQGSTLQAEQHHLR